MARSRSEGGEAFDGECAGTQPTPGHSGLQRITALYPATFLVDGPPVEARRKPCVAYRLGRRRRVLRGRARARTAAAAALCMSASPACPPARPNRVRRDRTGHAGKGRRPFREGNPVPNHPHELGTDHDAKAQHQKRYGGALHATVQHPFVFTRAAPIREPSRARAARFLASPPYGFRQALAFGAFAAKRSRAA